MTTLVDLRAYCEAKKNGLNPVLPRHADVIMKPGKNDEGWWAGVEKQMQVELMGDIFNAVFNTDLDLAGCTLFSSPMHALILSYDYCIIINIVHVTYTRVLQTMCEFKTYRTH